MEVVKDRPEPERIEIELTSNELPHADPDGGEVVVEGPSDESSPAVATDQRRMFAVATVVGVVALLLGWLIGRGSGGDEVAMTSVTTPETTEVVVATVLPGEKLPSASTTTSRPPRTTTTLPRPSVEIIRVDPRLAGVDLTLVGVQRGGSWIELVELDLAEQTLTRRSLGRSFEAETLMVGGDWVALGSPGGGTTTMFRDGEPGELLDLGEPWELRWQEGSDLFWRPDWDREGFNGPSAFEQIDLNGEPTGVVLELPVGTWAALTDPRGGFIVDVDGKQYSISEAGVSQVGTGMLVGVSDRLVVTRECDGQLRCGLSVTDRDSGAVQQLSLDGMPGGPTAFEPVHGWGGPAPASISPDGSMCLVILHADNEPRLGVIDLRSGAVAELGVTWWMPAAVWSPDGRFVFFLDGSDGFGGFGAERIVTAYEHESGDIFPVSTGETAWETLLARPVAG